MMMRRYLARYWEELAIVAVLITAVVLFVQAVHATPVDEMIVVRTNESCTLRYNPQVHGVLQHELPDGDIAISVVPLENIEATRRVFGEVKKP
jgi:hypothetical protein